MSKPVLVAQIRERTKKKGLRALRNEGFVPAIVYGSNVESKNIKIQKNEVERVLNKCEIGSSVELNINSDNTLAIIKDIQRHIVKQNVLHIDFQELTKGEKVRVKIPVHLINKSAVENSTLVVQEQLKEIEIQTLPKYLPQSIDVNASILKDKDAIKVSDIDICNDENIEILSDTEQIIALLAHASREEAAVTDEEEELTDL